MLRISPLLTSEIITDPFFSTNKPLTNFCRFESIDKARFSPGKAGILFSSNSNISRPYVSTST
jgi:hypothetical protein